MKQVSFHLEKLEFVLEINFMKSGKILGFGWTTSWKCFRVDVDFDDFLGNST